MSEPYYGILYELESGNQGIMCLENGAPWSREDAEQACAELLERGYVVKGQEKVLKAKVFRFPAVTRG